MPSSSFLSDSIVVVSDRIEHISDYPHRHDSRDARFPACLDPEPVVGGYLERLPRAMMAAGHVRHAEIWHHHRGDDIHSQQDSPALMRRAFPVSDDRPPFHSDRMIDFVRAHGAPKVLCVWGLGVSKDVLEACADSFIIYNSIDAPALRVPVEVSRHFHLVLTAAHWQSEELRERHPDTPTVILPIGPEFASPETFFPLDEPKRHDVIYVAAAQPYKRHDLLFEALSRASRSLTALCVMGYGDDGDRLRSRAREMNLAVDFVGPPGVSYAQVNRLMNQARVGIVCGIEDGAPAILTEYMLAGLPVVANASLRCGLQYILPQTGVIAPADALEIGILEALERSDFTPRQTVLDRWAWQHSVRTLGDFIPLSNTDSNQHRIAALAKG
jgi:glycosyltransferase involved in cell wall biosynthesis